MMLHIVNPSAEIREGFENHLVQTTDGRTLNGFLVERDNKIVVLRGADGQTTVISRDQIDDMKVIPQSLMPEGLLNGLADQQVRDLFAYLRSGQPLNVKD
jgi:putative heme-binding domain-containing protein